MSLPSRRSLSLVSIKVGSGTHVAVESKVEAIQRISEPTDKRSLRSFLGMANYYKSHVANFSEVCVPLTDLLKKSSPKKFVLNVEQRRAFNEIKRLLKSSVELTSPDPCKPFVLQCDASDYAIGACLSQMDENSVECPIAFMSKKLSDVQRRYAPIEREAFAVIYALNYFDVLIYGRRVEVFTDHDPLKYRGI